MSDPVDLVLHNGVVHSPMVAAGVTALAVRNGKVVATGNDALAARADTRVDLDGRCVLPGFHDAHAHTARFGMGLRQVDLSSARTIEELQRRVAERATGLPAGAWLIAHSYDHITLGRHPRKTDLDPVAPDHLVWLKHRTEHMGVANSRLLQRAGVDAHTMVAGGRVELDENGQPDGLLVETAQGLVNDLLVPVDQSELVEAIAAAHRHYLSEGVTSCQEAGVGGGWIGLSGDEPLAYVEADRQDRLHVRTTLMPSYEALVPSGPGSRLMLPAHYPRAFDTNMLRWGPVKLFADGALTGRTAAMTTGYANDPANTGLLQADPHVLRERILAVHRSGWQVATHAIGDHAIDVALGAYRDALDDVPHDDPRFRIEHCSVVRPDQVDAIAALGVVPVMQTFFVEALGDAVAANLGERAAWAYRLRSLLDRGVPVANSSDRPIADGNPLRAIQRMLERTTANGAPFGTGEEIDFTRALTAATLTAAYAARMEHEVGTLVPGMDADLVVLDRDPAAVSASELPTARVELTMVKGATRYDPQGIAGDAV